MFCHKTMASLFHQIIYFFSQFFKPEICRYLPVFEKGHRAWISSFLSILEFGDTEGEFKTKVGIENRIIQEATSIQIFECRH